LLYTYFHDRNVDFKITAATFTKEFWALNVGATINSGSIVTLVNTEKIMLDGSNAGTLTLVPTGTCTGFFSNGSSYTVTPAGQTVTFATGANQVVTVVYNYQAAADQIVAESTKPPTNVELVLTAEVRDSSGALVEYLQVDVPHFQVSGNYSLSLAANGVSQQALDGVALLVNSTDLTNGDFYYKVSWIPVSAVTVPISDIALTPSILTFLNSSGLPQTKAFNLLGIRGGLYSNLNLTNSGSYAHTSGCVTITTASYTGQTTVSAAGKVGDSALITVTYWDPSSGSLTDTATARLVA
jgi:hypothetical protein